MVRVEFPAWVAAFSERPDGDLRVSARAPGEPLAAVQARVLASLRVATVAVAGQVHGTVVVLVEDPPHGYVVGVAEGDGVVTATPGVAAAVHVADCVPVGVGGEGGVAMLHCGWRGLAGGIIAEGIAALRALGVEGELQGAIGPGAGGCCYETGDEVRERFAEYAAADPQAAPREPPLRGAGGGFRGAGGRLLDLKAVAAAQLRAAGVGAVEDVAVCTICAAPERLFSHRRDGAATGRQGGFAWLR
jgi:YfiH family protein